jgi:hypothetical protein
MKAITLFLIFALTLRAQEEDLPPPPPPPTDTQWQNWVFAATALVTAAAGVYVVSLNDGKDAP